jgi:hypothetical protein
VRTSFIPSFAPVAMCHFDADNRSLLRVLGKSSRGPFQESQSHLAGWLCPAGWTLSG